MPNRVLISFNEYLEKFKYLIKKLGLNHSMQREYILKVLFDSKTYLSADEIQKIVRDKHRISIGISTIYRVLDFLEELSIVNIILINCSNSKMYELNRFSHQDHKICLRCGKIIRLTVEDSEKIQAAAVDKNGFSLLSRTMVLYGICADCHSYKSNNPQ